MTKLEGVKDIKAEGVEPTEPKVEPTVEKTYTEKELRTELDKGIGKGLESINRQLSLRGQEVNTIKAETEQHKIENTSLKARLEALTSEVDNALAEDPDAKKAYTSRTAILDKELAAAADKAEAQKMLLEAQNLTMANSLKSKSDNLLKGIKDRGIDTSDLVTELENCQTEDEMELKALRFQVNAATESKPAELAIEDPQFISGAGGGGDSLDGMSPKDKLKEIDKRLRKE